MQKNMQNGTTQDAYRNMVNVTEGFGRFAEMWMPFMKSIQEKTFNTDMYKQYMNPAMYKEVMDKFFGFMPEQSRQYMQNMTDMMQKGMGQMNQMGMGNYQQVRGMMNNMMPNTSDMFSGMLNGYNTWYSNLNNAMSPITKMMTPNQHTKAMMEWNDIANRMMVYNIKNAEMQYMIYNQGVKVMDSLAENIAAKVEKGEEISNMMAVYQEWLNISDKVYVSLFESEEYSKLMAEVSAMQMKLRKDVEAQMEKMLVAVPVATRSEMDEMYKAIYDLKKQVRNLEKQLEATATESVDEVAKSKSKKA
jgi:class III poly(R)-hydroxyalkanoic acid synthase PhaE subunit